MIYLIRHQQYDLTNCLNNLGVKNSNAISIQFLNKKVNVITIIPDIHKNKNTTHVRPLQTATIICTNTNNNLIVINNYKDIKNYINSNNDTLVVWHHSELPTILDYLTNKNNNFYWNDDNYSGCITIDNNMKKWNYINNIYDTKIIL